MLLFPASLAALALTHRLIDAINPLALWRVCVGMGGTYLVLVAAEVFIAVCGAIATLAVNTRMH